MGEALWDALHGGRQPEGIRPFGVEAQRLLRLEKGHIIIGQDTDGLTNPDRGRHGVGNRAQEALLRGQALDRDPGAERHRRASSSASCSTTPSATGAGGMPPHLEGRRDSRPRYLGGLVRHRWSKAIGLAYVLPEQSCARARFSTSRCRRCGREGPGGEAALLSIPTTRGRRCE